MSNTSTLKHNSQLIKDEAKRLGFFNCGIVKARFLNEEEDNYKQWLANGYNATMQYMQNNFEKRLDPTLLVENAKSIIVLLFPYYPKKQQKYTDAPVISKYAYGTDYHFVIKDKLSLLFDFINNNIAKIEGRKFVDSAPVAEKKWAELAGLGWRGKNSNLITKNGSYFFISELIIDLELHYDSPATNHCGTCTKCIDACPTNAIVSNAIIDANKCISFQTIENKGEIDIKLKEQFENRVFGCDICQDVCPYNRKPVFHSEEAFLPHNKLLDMTKEEWHDLTQEEFSIIFKKSAVKRTKYTGLRRNLDFLSEL